MRKHYDTLPPTPAERLKIYEIALLRVKKGSFCICYGIQDAQFQLGFKSKNGQKWETTSGKYGKNCMSRNFPDLLKHKPKGRTIGYFWWNFNFEQPKRIEVLEQLVAALKVELNIQ